MAVRPYIFIGSSREALNVATVLQVGLQYDAETVIWNQGLFQPGLSTLETLLSEAPKFDFAVMVLRAEDLVESRGQTQLAPRDNVMFELGLFMGTLGRERTFFVYSRDNPPKLPSDLAGITAISYAEPNKGTLEAALGPVCLQIRNAAVRLGLREDRRLDRLDHATREVEGVGEKVEQMVKLLLRSRKIEIELVAKQFGLLINPASLAKMNADLADLENLVQSLNQSPKEPT